MNNIINCISCGQPVPDHLNKCPYCNELFKKTIAIQRQTSHAAASKACPKCAMIVPDKAHVCPYCRKTIATSPVAIMVAGFFAILVIGGMVIGQTSTPSPQYIDPGLKYKIEAQSIITSMLKTPSVAKFVGVSFSEEPTEFIVGGDVDSQNSYGAMIRTGWICHFYKNGDPPKCSILSNSP